MKIEEKENRVFFNYDDKSFANISINKESLKLELLETLPKFRHQHNATKLMKIILNYIIKRHKEKKIYLNPLPLDRWGLKLEKLVAFYAKFGFKSSSKKERHCPFLMEKAI